MNQFIVSIHPVSCPTLHLFYIDRCVEYRLHHQLCILIFKLTPTLVTVAVRIRDGLDAQPGTQVILIQGSIRFAYYLYRNIDRILQPYILHCQCHTIRTSVQLLFSVIRPGLHHIIIGRREQGSITITLFLFELCCVSKRRSKMFTGMRFVMSSADDNLGIGIVHFKSSPIYIRTGAPGATGGIPLSTRLRVPSRKGGIIGKVSKRCPSYSKVVVPPVG